MQPVATTDPAFGKAGGHTYSMTYKVVNSGVTNIVDKVDVCVKCHGPIEGLQLRPQGLRRRWRHRRRPDRGAASAQQTLHAAAELDLPGGSSNYVADGLVKTSISVKTNWPTKFLQCRLELAVR